MNNKYVTYFKSQQSLQINYNILFYLLSAKTINYNIKFEKFLEIRNFRNNL